MNSGVDFASILSATDDNQGANSSENKSIVADRRNSARLSSIASDKDTDEIDDGKNDEKNVFLQKLEKTSKDKIKGSLLINYLKSAERPFMLVFLILSFLLTQILASGADMFFPYW